jgi:hypothetical protein
MVNGRAEKYEKKRSLSSDSESNRYARYEGHELLVRCDADADVPFFVVTRRF